MKILAFLVLLLTFSIRPLFAQDLLTKRTGEELLVKVLEITPTEVKFRRSDNPDGPLISVWKTDLFLVRYANGTQDVFNALPANTVRSPASFSRPAAVAPAAAVINPAPALVPAPAAALPVVNNAAPGDALLDESVHLSGPRIGLTVLSSGIVQEASDRGVNINPVISQFGWQFETRLFRLSNGTSALVEFVPLVGGLEQNRFIPSISGLLGFRGAGGLEFGVGPNITPFGTGLVLAVGASVQSGGVNFPINLAVAPSAQGARVSLLLGFNARRR